MTLVAVNMININLYHFLAYTHLEFIVYYPSVLITANAVYSRYQSVYLFLKQERLKMK